MISDSEIVLDASNVRSLIWAGDRLTDYVAGGVRYELTGTMVRASVRYAYDFDCALNAPDTPFAVIYERLGTKALLLKNGTIIRELNRSFYHANVYEYPICLFKYRDRVLLVHCPESYNRLEIDDAETGERLTTRTTESADFFHSRISANPSGTRLLSAGWVWHPWDSVIYFDVERALHEPQHLDAVDWRAPTSGYVGLTEESFATWQDDRRTIVTSGSGPEDDEDAIAENADQPRLTPNGVAVYDTADNEVVSSVALEKPAGSVMAIGTTHCVAFYEHPRLIRLQDGFVEKEWPHLSSGQQISSIVFRRETLPPPMALDRAKGRFAIAQADGIHVVTVSV